MRKRRLKRKGECFTTTTKVMMDLPPSTNQILVHGLPQGNGGEAAIAGRFPHAWIELDGMVWDPNKDDWFPKSFYYDIGNVEYTVRYTKAEVDAIVQKKRNYGPWDKTILDRDREINAMRVSASQLRD